MTAPRPNRPRPAVMPPDLLLKWQTWAVLMAILIVPFFVPIPQVLRRNPVISPLGDQLHVFLLAGVAFLLYWRGPLTGRLLRAAAAAAVVGGAIEFIQIPFGRNAAWMDFVRDLIGIGIVVGFVLWRGHGRRLGLAVMAVLLLTLPLQLYRVPFVAAAAYDCRDTFPLLSNLEGKRDHWIWGGNQALCEVVAVTDGPQGPGHVVRLIAEPPASWPSVEMRHFPPDWQQYSHLVFEVRLAEGPADSTRFGVRLDDFVGRQEQTWIADREVATHQWQTIRIPLQNRQVSNGPELQERLFDLSDTDRIIFYLSRPTARTVLEFDDLRLE